MSSPSKFFQLHLYGSRDKGPFATIPALAAYCAERKWTPHEVTVTEWTLPDGRLEYVGRRLPIAQIAQVDPGAPAPIWDLHESKVAYVWKLEPPPPEQTDGDPS